MADEKQFAKGIYFEKPRDGAPDFVKGKLSFKVADAIAFLQAHENNAGYVNCDVKESREGKMYVELNTWQKGERPAVAEPQEDAIDYPAEEINPDDIPF